MSIIYKCDLCSGIVADYKNDGVCYIKKPYKNYRVIYYNVMQLEGKHSYSREENALICEVCFNKILKILKKERIK